MNGSQRVLITDHGAHSPEKWALATADHLVHLDEAKANPAEIIAARKLETAIAEALAGHHAKVQGLEASSLSADAEAHLAKDYDASEHIAEAVAAVVACAKGTPFEAHFARADVQEQIGEVIHQHFRSAQHIARSWHCDKNPRSPAAQAWRAKHHAAA